MIEHECCQPARAGCVRGRRRGAHVSEPAETLPSAGRPAGRPQESAGSISAVACASGVAAAARRCACQSPSRCSAAYRGSAGAGDSLESCAGGCDDCVLGSRRRLQGSRRRRSARVRANASCGSRSAKWGSRRRIWRIPSRRRFQPTSHVSWQIRNSRSCSRCRSCRRRAVRWAARRRAVMCRGRRFRRRTASRPLLRMARLLRTALGSTWRRQRRQLVWTVLYARLCHCPCSSPITDALEHGDAGCEHKQCTKQSTKAGCITGRCITAGDSAPSGSNRRKLASPRRVVPTNKDAQAPQPPAPQGLGLTGILPPPSGKVGTNEACCGTGMYLLRQFSFIIQKRCGITLRRLQFFKLTRVMAVCGPASGSQTIWTLLRPVRAEDRRFGSASAPHRVRGRGGPHTAGCSVSHLRPRSWPLRRCLLHQPRLSRLYRLQTAPTL